MRVTFDENELYFPDDMDEDELKSLIGSYREQQRIARVNNPNYGDSVTKAGMASPTTPSLAEIYSSALVTHCMTAVLSVIALER